MEIKGIEKVRTKNKCDVVTEEIINLIVSRTFKPGEKLPTENELVELFGVSRVTVRESLKRLSSMGIVSIYQGDGTFVNTFNLTNFMKPLFSLMVLSELSIEQLYDARLYVEVGMVSLAAKSRQFCKLEKLEAMLVEQRIAVEQEDDLAFTELDWQFHLLIGEASDNEVLLSAYMMIKDILKHYIKKTNRRPVVMSTSLGFHEKIVDAIARQDRDDAEALMRGHINNAKQSLLDSLKQAQEIAIHIEKRKVGHER